MWGLSVERCPCLWMNFEVSSSPNQSEIQGLGCHGTTLHPAAPWWAPPAPSRHGSAPKQIQHAVLREPRALRGGEGSAWAGTTPCRAGGGSLTRHILVTSTATGAAQCVAAPWCRSPGPPSCGNVGPAAPPWPPVPRKQGEKVPVGTRSTTLAGGLWGHAHLLGWAVPVSWAQPCRGQPQAILASIFRVSKLFSSFSSLPAHRTESSRQLVSVWGCRAGTPQGDGAHPGLRGGDRAPPARPGAALCRVGPPRLAHKAWAAPGGCCFREAAAAPGRVWGSGAVTPPGGRGSGAGPLLPVLSAHPRCRSCRGAARKVAKNNPGCFGG